MRYLKFIGFVVSAALVFCSSCQEEEKNQMFMSVSGNPGDVIIVSTTHQWNGQIGDAIKTHFEAPVYGMPQEEPLFDLVQTKLSDFERIFETFRSVVIIDLDTNRFAKGEIEYRKDVWAKGQLVIQVKGSTRDEVVDLINENADQMIRIIQTKELNRLAAKYKAHPNEKVKSQLMKNLGVAANIPKEAVIARIDSTHAWIRIEREKLKGGYKHQVSQGLLITKYPYTAKQQFLDTVLLEQRDRILKKYIPGPSEGSYMATEYRYYPPTSKEVDYYGHFGKEFHGLWRMENDFMGGPMVSFFVLNEDEGMIYCISGYAFAPQFNKREYYREIEAIVKSVKF